MNGLIILVIGIFIWLVVFAYMTNQRFEKLEAKIEELERKSALGEIE